MRKPKFKVGDKVKVMRASTDEEYDLWKDSWMLSMNCAIGKIMTIKYVNPNGNLYPKYSFEEIGLNFPEFVLQNDMRVGQQLVFNFMEE